MQEIAAATAAVWKGPQEPCPLETWARNPALCETQMLEALLKIVFFLPPNSCLPAWHGANASMGSWGLSPCQEAACPRLLGNP